MASKKQLNFKERLSHLDKLGQERADSIAGPAPSADIEQRLAFAATLENGSASRSPLATVLPLPRADEIRPALSFDTQYVPYRPGQLVRVGDRLSVALHLVRPNDLNPRAFYLDEDIKDRSISLANDGQLLAVQVYPPDNDVFELHDGETRWRSLKLVGHETVNVEVVERNPDALVRFKQARALNTERKSQTVFDDAVRFNELLKKGVLKETSDLAMAFGLSAPYVSKVLGIGEMPMGLLERMARHPESFGIANAYSMYQFWAANGRDAASAEKLVAKVIDGRLSVRDVKHLVESPKDTAAGTAAGRKRERPLSRAEIRSGAKGELKAFPDGKLQLVLQEIPESSRALLFRRILQVFEECGMKFDAVGVPTSEEEGQLTFTG